MTTTALTTQMQENPQTALRRADIVNERIRRVRDMSGVEAAAFFPRGFTPGPSNCPDEEIMARVAKIAAEEGMEVKLLLHGRGWTVAAMPVELGIVVVAYPTGHPVAKSLHRNIRRATRVRPEELTALRR